MSIRHFLVPVLAAAAWFVCSSCSEPPFPRSVVIVGATLVDPFLPNSVVVIQGDRIVAAGPQQSVPIPANSDKVNAAGKFLKAAGRVRQGGRADLVLLNRDKQVERTMEGGKWIDP